MRIQLDMPFTKEELAGAIVEAGKGNAVPLRVLCQKEVERFEVAIRKHPDYSDGLVMIEQRVVEGYLYQKLRGHIDANDETSDLPEEG